MTQDECWTHLEKLAVHFGNITVQQKADYYSHLRGYTDTEMANAVFTLIDSRKWKSYPLPSEIRTVLDKIRFDNRIGPTDEERDAYYDGLTCSACNGTGFIIADNVNWKPGESGAVASFCQCRKGKKRESGIKQYLENKKLRRHVEYERRHEPEESA
jgi:hypothetical protein